MLLAAIYLLCSSMRLRREIESSFPTAWADCAGSDGNVHSDFLDLDLQSPLRTTIASPIPRPPRVLLNAFMQAQGDLAEPRVQKVKQGSAFYWIVCAKYP
jgi:hypothetical protein